MLRTISFNQLKRWQLFYELEPFGEKRNDYRFASIVQALSNIYRDSKKKPDPYTLDDCVLKFGESEEVAAAPKRSTWQSMKDSAKLLVSAFSKPEAGK